MSFPNTHKTFCKKCRNISWTNPSPGEGYSSSWKFDHYTTFFQLEASADKGCHLCQNIWTTLVHDNPSTSWYAGKSLTRSSITRMGMTSLGEGERWRRSVSWSEIRRRSLCSFRGSLANIISVCWSNSRVLALRCISSVGDSSRVYNASGKQLEIDLKDAFLGNTTNYGYHPPISYLGRGWT